MKFRQLQDNAICKPEKRPRISAIEPYAHHTSHKSYRLFPSEDSGQSQFDAARFAFGHVERLHQEGDILLTFRFASDRRLNRALLCQISLNTQTIRMMGAPKTTKDTNRAPTINSVNAEIAPIFRIQTSCGLNRRRTEGKETRTNATASHLIHIILRLSSCIRYCKLMLFFI